MRDLIINIMLSTIETRLNNNIIIVNIKSKNNSLEQNIIYNERKNEF